VIANHNLRLERLDGTTKMLELCKKPIIVLAISAHVTLGVWDNDTHCSRRPNNPITLRQKLYSVAKVQIRQKMLAMNVPNTTISEWKPIQYI